MDAAFAEQRCLETSILKLTEMLLTSDYVKYYLNTLSGVNFFVSNVITRWKDLHIVVKLENIRREVRNTRHRIEMGV